MQIRSSRRYAEFFFKKNKPPELLILGEFTGPKFALDNIISISNHMFEKAIWDKLPECIFENLETAQVKRRQFQNVQKSRG